MSPDYRDKIAGLKDTTVTITGTFDNTRPIPSLHAMAAERHRKQGDRAWVVGCLVAWGALAAAWWLPDLYFLVLAGGLAVCGMVACVLWAGAAARAGTLRYLRRLAVEPAGPPCTTDTPCDVCRGVKSWDGTSSDGSTATADGVRWV